MRFLFVFFIIIIFFVSQLLFAETDASFNKGNFSNLVVLIKFADDDSEYTENISHFDSIFNSKNSVSLYNYYKEASYNKFFVNSIIPQPPNSSHTVSYTDINNRNYYCPKSSYNSVGYENQDMALARKNILITGALRWAEKYISDNVNLDSDNNGKIDNVTFIMSGNSCGTSILYPHKSSASEGQGFDFSMKNKHLENYIIVLNGSLNLGTIVHEFFHTIGATDLYHSSATQLNPIYYWDIMEYPTSIPQSMCSYVKYKYGNWIEDIPTITAPGVYTLNPITDSVNNCYKIASKNTQQYYVVEYRKPVGLYESNLNKIYNQTNKIYEKFDGGLLVYRINTIFDGKGNFNASNDADNEIYCYRLNGTQTNNGQPWNAAFNMKYKRDKFNSTTNPMPYLADGSDGKLNITDIYEQDNVLYFTLHIYNKTYIKYPANGEVGVSLLPTIKWDKLEEARHYQIQIAEESSFINTILEGSVFDDSVYYVRNDNKLLPNKYYYLRVAPVEETGYVRYWSKTIYFKTANNFAINNIFTTLCAGTDISLKVDVISDLPDDNIFYVLMSDKNGNFNNADTIGSLISNISSSIPMHIPDTLPSSNKYKIRLQNNDPDNYVQQNNIHILGLPEATIDWGDSIKCLNSVSIIEFNYLIENVKDDFYEYIWSAKNAIIDSIDLINNKIFINWNKLGNAEITLTTHNINGCGNTYTKKFNVNSPPKLSLTVPNNVCPEQNISYYFPDERFMATDIKITNGSWERKNKDTISIIWENKESGIINIKRSNDFCADSISIVQVINKLPDFQIIGEEVLCYNDTSIYSIDIANIDNYLLKWEVVNGKIIGNNNQNNCYLTGDDNFVNLKLTLTDKQNSCSISKNINIKIQKQLDKPLIYFDYNNSYLTCSEYANEYKWYFNDILIENSNTKELQTIKEGNYYVEIVDEYGCSINSDVYNLVSIDAEETEFNIALIDNNIIISIKNEIAPNIHQGLHYEIYDLLGKKNKDGTIINLPYNIDFNNNKNNFYYLVLFDGKKNIISTKFIFSN